MCACGCLVHNLQSLVCVQVADWQSRQSAPSGCSPSLPSLLSAAVLLLVVSKANKPKDPSSSLHFLFLPKYLAIRSPLAHFSSKAAPQRAFHSQTSQLHQYHPTTPSNRSIMFCRRWSGLPSDPEFPANITELGFVSSIANAWTCQGQQLISCSQLLHQQGR